LELHLTKPEQTLNDEIFNKIYPNTIYKLPDLLSNMLSIEKIKKIINKGIASKTMKNISLKNEYFQRKQMHKTYTLPSLKSNQKNIGYEPTIFQTPLKPTTALCKSEENKSLDSTCKRMTKKYRFIKSPTVKLTYQLGPSLTDTHSIRIKGKLLERIKIKNDMWKKKTGGGVLSVMGMNNSNTKNNTPKNEFTRDKTKVNMPPKICVHEVEFVNIFKD